MSEPLFAVDALDKGEGLEFQIQRNGEWHACFALRHHGEIVAYHNRCPHTGVELNWQPGIFLDAGGEHIQCSVHGALFSPENGACLFGPCAGRHLTAVPLVEREGHCYLVDEAEGTGCYDAPSDHLQDKQPRGSS